MSRLDLNCGFIIYHRGLDDNLYAGEIIPLDTLNFSLDQSSN